MHKILNFFLLHFMLRIETYLLPLHALWEGGFHSTTPPYATSTTISEDLPIIIVFYHLTHSLLDVLHCLYVAVTGRKRTLFRF